MTRHPFLSEGRSDLLAHRGDSAGHPPGNTWAAFASAVDLGIDHIETDVQATADGVVVVYHDEELDETTTGSGTIGDHTWRELEAVRYRVDGAASPAGLVRLDEVLTAYPDIFFNIDIKTDATVAPAVEVLRRHDAARRVCVAAFGWRRLRRLRAELGDGWCTAYSQAEIVAARIAAWIRLPVPRWGDAVQVPTERRGVTVVDRRFVDACHRRDIAVHVWTINDGAEQQRLRSIGVDAVITDVPAKLRATMPE